MDKTVFSLLLLSGLFGISSLSREYFYISETKTWQDAQKYCREVYTDLATIENMNDNNRAKDNVDLFYYGNVWIGLNKGADVRWGWSLGENTLSQYNMWAQDEPRNDFLDGHCGLMYKNGYWYTENCLYTNKFVCYYDYDGMFYYSKYNMLTWKEAQLYCRNHYTDLASIRNSDELSRVSSFLSSADYLWLGLFADTWTWSDQSSSSFRNWGSEKPLNLLNYSNCIVMDMNDYGSWKNLICDLKLPFLCYKVASLKKRQIVEVKVSSDGNKDLNDPLVKADILKQIDEKLRGMGNYTNLSWRENNGKVFSPEVKKRNVTDGL